MLAAIACLMCNPRRNPRLPLDSPPHATTSAQEEEEDEDDDDNDKEEDSPHMLLLDLFLTFCKTNLLKTWFQVQWKT